jgi:hypothetical protein
LWGAATAAHQVEGNNINSDLLVLEHLRATLFAEPSLDACDHYHRFEQDIRLLAGLGLTTYRFSIEWARIEPERGHFSLAALDHYRRMLAACHENGVTPMVTFYHFSSPRWFAALGGWENPASVDLFARYSERAARHLGDLMKYATTFNEPNLPMLLRWVANLDIPLRDTLDKVARECGHALMQLDERWLRRRRLGPDRRRQAALIGRLVLTMGGVVLLTASAGEAFGWRLVLVVCTSIGVLLAVASVFVWRWFKKANKALEELGEAFEDVLWW